MKRKLILLLVLTLLFSFVGCTKNKISTKEDVIKFVEEKGAKNVEWKDFEHLEHKDVGSGLILEVYFLSDGNYMLLNGTSYEDKPNVIGIYDSNNKLIKEFK